MRRDRTTPLHIFAQGFSHGLSAVLVLVFLLLLPLSAPAAKVLVVGDTQYPVVAEVVSDIQLSLRSQVSEYAVSDVRGRLGSVVEQEDARVVVALGMDALAEALRLPPAIAVVYGLVVVPPATGRGNVTGVYMSPPVNEYVATLRKYIPSVGRVAVVGSERMMKTLLGGASGDVSAHYVATSAELLSTVSHLSDSQALLLLPDANLLSSSVMEKLFLFSFRNNIPLLGISEAHVKNGALLSYVFDPKTVSRQIAEKVQSILGGADAGELHASPPRKYNLYVNSNTARKMGVRFPDELLRKAKRIYN